MRMSVSVVVVNKKNSSNKLAVRMMIYTQCNRTRVRLSGGTERKIIMVEELAQRIVLKRREAKVK